MRRHLRMSRSPPRMPLASESAAQSEGAFYLHREGLTIWLVCVNDCDDGEWFWYKDDPMPERVVSSAMSHRCPVRMG